MAPNRSVSPKPGVLTPGRVTLLASVAALGASVLLAGPGGYQPSGLTSPARATETMAQHPASFADVAAKVKPAVISVRVKVNAAAETGLMEQNGDEDANPSDSPMYKFFRNFAPEGMPRLRQRPEMVTGEGSGFFITGDGYAVTNYHVVDHAKSVQVTADDGASYTAKVVGADPKTDLALIKVDGKDDFSFVKFAEYAPRVGDWVIAVGNRHVTRGWLGVQIQPVTAGIADSLGLKKAEGAMVDEPQEGSPAAEAGIETGDIITAVDGTKVKDARELARTIGMLAPNTKAKLDIIRQGQEKSLTVTIGEMSNEHQAKADTEEQTPSSGIPHLGLSLAPAGDVAGAGDKGVVVMNVEPDGPAAEQGFERGNVILDVGGKPVANVGDVRNALKEAKTQGKRAVLMRVKMGDATRFVAVPLGTA
jgi:S1-C subfamily serine protease